MNLTNFTWDINNAVYQTTGTVLSAETFEECKRLCQEAVIIEVNNTVLYLLGMLFIMATLTYFSLKYKPLMKYAENIIFINWIIVLLTVIGLIYLY